MFSRASWRDLLSNIEFTQGASKKPFAHVCNATQSGLVQPQDTFPRREIATLPLCNTDVHGRMVVAGQKRTHGQAQKP